MSEKKFKITALNINPICFSVYCDVGSAFVCVNYANFVLQRIECCSHIFNSNRWEYLILSYYTVERGTAH